MSEPTTQPPCPPELPRLPAKLPESMRWLFWELDFDGTDFSACYRTVAARVLERGRLQDVRWLLDHGGYEGVHTYFRHYGDVEISARTTTFWRLVLNAKDEPWSEPPAWKRSKSSPWGIASRW